MAEPHNSLVSYLLLFFCLFCLKFLVNYCMFFMVEPKILTLSSVGSIRTQDPSVLIFSTGQSSPLVGLQLTKKKKGYFFDILIQHFLFPKCVFFLFFPHSHTQPRQSLSMKLDSVLFHIVVHNHIIQHFLFPKSVFFFT